MKFLTVDVTQEDIDKGQTPWRDQEDKIWYYRGSQCPLGVALQRMGHKVSIFGEFLSIDGVNLTTSKKVQAFVAVADKAFQFIDGYSPPGRPWSHNTRPREYDQVPRPVEPTRLRVRYE